MMIRSATTDAIKFLCSCFPYCEAKRSIRAKKVAATLLISFFLLACNNATKQKIAADSTPTIQKQIIDTTFDYSLLKFDTLPTKHLQIGNTGLTIDLPITHKIEPQKGDDFMVYYFTPVDTSIDQGEGGIYFGPKPDDHPPSTNYTKKIIPGSFLGVKTNWVEYTTNNYTQTETFIDNGAGQKIHVWYYASNLTEMAKFLKVIRSIRR